MGKAEAHFQLTIIFEWLMTCAMLLSISQKKSIVALVGHSRGGNVVLFHASKYNDVPTAVSISGCFDLEARIDPSFGTCYLQQIRQNGFTDIKDKIGKILYQATQDNLKARRVATQSAALSIDTNCRVLIVHGSEDELVPVADALEFSKLIRNHKLRVIEGGDHEFSSHKNELVATVLNFIIAGSIFCSKKKELE
ncbi:hypothetical protein QQ045_002126 [Rhodiola kirilowii]